MKKGWTKVAIGEVLKSRNESCILNPETEYKEVTVSLWGKGVRLRRNVLGSEISATQRNVARSGDFIISKIDARHGAYGFVPESLHGSVVTNDFPLFGVAAKTIAPQWLYWVSQSRFFVELCRAASEGSTNRVRLKEAKFKMLEIPLPPMLEQKRIAAHLDAIEARLARVQKLREEQELKLLAALRSAFHTIEAKSDWVEMGKVAPLVRREVGIDLEGSYPELGIRSFGRGTFHKPAVLGMETTKRLFEIHAGDLVFSNVFAWEGAIAVAQPEDHGRLGSHRFISCVCDKSRVLPDYLQFYFLTPGGLEKIGKASPGGAGRNRTLGIQKLADIKVPIVPLATQQEFKKLLDLRVTIQREAQSTNKRISALLPSLLDRIFNT